MKKFRDLKKSLVYRFDLAAEAAGCTRLTLIDNTHACIENHKGITEYTQKKVCVKAGGLNIAISGSGLVLERFGRENVMIKGDIQAVQYENLRR
ncbi:MAG: YabP/YqfC family sporulation protein [Christensenellales bacterium]